MQHGILSNLFFFISAAEATCERLDKLLRMQHVFSNRIWRTNHTALLLLTYAVFLWTGCSQLCSSDCRSYQGLRWRC
jgi:hypothetical protein